MIFVIDELSTADSYTLYWCYTKEYASAPTPGIDPEDLYYDEYGVPDAVSGFLYDYRNQIEDISIEFYDGDFEEVVKDAIQEFYREESGFYDLDDEDCPIEVFMSRERDFGPYSICIREKDTV